MLSYPVGTSTEDIEGGKGLLGLLARLLRPIARLCLANGITFATAVEVLKRAFVQEARAMQPEAPEHGTVSRISTVTGINRREVGRLTKAQLPDPVTKKPLAAELMARWLTDPSLRDAQGLPAALQRTGTGQSFENLSQLVTRDVHPRTILDELLRQGMVRHDLESDEVSLVCDDFIPKADSQQMLAFLSDNVGDHLEAAVDNVTDGNDRHLEQAIFADELSMESVRALQSRIIARWQALREEMVPAITELIESDRKAGRRQDQRIRIGLYSFTALDDSCSKLHKKSRQRRFRTVAQKEARP